MQHAHWEYPKCEHTDFETDEFRATGGVLAQMFDVQNKRFTTVSCTRCHFTEIYKTTSSQLGNIFDFFTN